MKQLSSYEGLHCANCGVPMHGEYCHACGQSIHSVLKPIHGLLEETVEPCCTSTAASCIRCRRCC